MSYQERIKALYDEANNLSVQAANKDTEMKALGDQAPADAGAQVDALILAAQEKIDAAAALEGEAKAALDREQKIAQQREALRASAGRLPGMGSGSSEAKGFGDDDGVPASPVAGTLLELKDGYVGRQMASGFHRLVPLEEFRQNKTLQAIAKPEYKAEWLKYATGRPDCDFKALSEGVDSAGGYLVPADMQSQIITRTPGLTVVEDRATIIQTSRDRVQIPRMKGATTDSTMYSSAVSFTMVGEVPTAGAGNTEPSWEQLEAQVHTAVLETTLSLNLVSDAAFGIEGFLTEEFQRAGTLGRDDRHLTGTGMLSPVGIMNDADITTVNTGSAAAMTGDGWQDLIHALPAQYRPGAIIGASRDCIAKTAKLKDGTGRYLLDAMNGGLAAGAPATILGVEYVVTDFLDAVAASAKPAFYGNLKNYWAIIRAELAIQVLRELKAREHQLIYLGFLRFGGAVSVPEAFRTATVSA